MNEFSQFAEHSVQKHQSKYFGVIRIIYPILIFLFTIAVNIFLSIALLGPFAVLSCAVMFVIEIIYCGKMFSTISYDYRITEGEIYFSTVYNNSKRKELGSVEISKFETIAPYKDQYKESANRLTYVKEINMTSSPESENIYFAVLPDPEDRSSKTIFLFEPSEKMLKLLKFHNRNTVIPRS